MDVVIRYPHGTLHYPAGDDAPGDTTRALCRPTGAFIGRGRARMRRRWFLTTRDRDVVNCRLCQRQLAREAPPAGGEPPGSTGGTGGAP